MAMESKNSLMFKSPLEQQLKYCVTTSCPSNSINFNEAH